MRSNFISTVFHGRFTTSEKDHYLAALIGRCFAELKKDSLHAMILNGGDVKRRLNRSTSSDHREKCFYGQIGSMLCTSRMIPEETTK